MNRPIHCLLAATLLSVAAFGQTADRWVATGNRAYRNGDYGSAAESYRKALAVDAGHPVAHHNLASALYRGNDLPGAESHFEKAAAGGRERQQTARSWYAKGVSLSRQGRTEESIEAYKQSLRLDPSNEWARENLVRALREKGKKDSEEEDRRREEKQSKGRTPPPLDKKELQRLLDALREQEKRLRQKAGKSVSGAPASREKDW